MAATFLPSNFLVPDPKYGANVNWTQFESAIPQSSTFIENIPSRLMVLVGRHSSYYDEVKPDVVRYFTYDNINNELTATFRFKNAFVQECTGYQLEKVLLVLPPHEKPNSGPRNLTQNNCGEYIDDSLSAPRRFVFSDCDMQIPLTVNGIAHSVNITSYLPYGRNIAYYSVSDILGYILTGVTDYMKTIVGDTTFYASIYIDDVGPRIYWQSTTYGLNNIRFLLRRVTGLNSTFWNIINDNIFISDVRVGDTLGRTGYVGESMGFSGKSDTGFQNNQSLVTVHCKELTSFRRSDNIAPTEGSSLIGVCSTFAPLVFANSDKTNFLYFSITDSSLISPKVSFDRTQAITELEVIFRLNNNEQSSEMKFTSTESESVQAALIFRLW